MALLYDDDMDSILAAMGGSSSDAKRKKGADDGPGKAKKKAKKLPSPSVCPPPAGSVWNSNVSLRCYDPAWRNDSSRRYATLKKTNCALEVLRHQSMNALAGHLKKLGEERGYQLPNSAFEVWQFAEKLDEGAAGDPIIPTKPSGAGKDTFWREVSRIGMKKRKVSDRLYIELNKAARQTAARISRNMGVGSGRKTQPVSIIREAESTLAGTNVDQPLSAKTQAKIKDRNRLEIKYGKTSFWLNAAHYNKLKELYRRWTVEPSKPTGKAGAGKSMSAELDKTDEKHFHEELFVLVCRYESLMGGGYQAALNEECFDVLLRHFGELTAPSAVSDPDPHILTCISPTLHLEPDHHRRGI
jgi:hypothetical protein